MNKERRKDYKYESRGDQAELRRRREEDSIRLRKEKREEQLAKRRNMGHFAVSSTEDEESTAEAVKSENFFIDQNMVNNLMSGEKQKEFEATQRFRKILSKEPNPPINKVLACGILPKLVEFLQKVENPALQFEAAWALTNIASGTTENTYAVVEAGAVPIFIMLMHSPDENVQDQAIWALGNIAGDNPQLRDMVLAEGMLPPLLNILKKPGNINVARNSVWALSNLCRGKKPPPDFAVVSAALPVLRTIIEGIDDQDVLSDGCWAISYLADGPNDKIDACVKAGVVPILVNLLSLDLQNVVSAALRAVGNIVTGDDSQTQAVLDARCLPYLHALLTKPGIREAIKKEAAWTVSNITAGTREQIQACIDNGLFPVLCDVIMSCQYRTKREAAWAITNALSGGNSEQIKTIVEQGAVAPLCELLSVGRSDVKCLEVALNGIEIILRCGMMPQNLDENGNNPYASQMEQCFGLEKLENLQDHENEDIYTRVIVIIEKFFGIEAEENMDNNELNPEITEAGTFQFGANQGVGGSGEAGQFQF